MERCRTRRRISSWSGENPSHSSQKGQGETEGQVGRDRMTEINSFGDVQEATVRVNYRWIRVGRVKWLKKKKKCYMKCVRVF